MVTRDIESALLRRHVASDQGNRNVDIQKHPAVKTMNVIVPFNAAIVSAGLVREGQFLDQPVLREQMQSPVYGAITDPRIATTHALKNFARGQVALRPSNLVKHLCPLSCIPESLSGHLTAQSFYENESQ